MCNMVFIDSGLSWEYGQDNVQWTVKYVQYGFYMSQVQLLRHILRWMCGVTGRNKFMNEHTK